jgi:hypothetical protein
MGEAWQLVSFKKCFKFVGRFLKQLFANCLASSGGGHNAVPDKASEIISHPDFVS